MHNDADLFRAGHRAYKMGANACDAPYRPGTIELNVWLEGYRAARQNKSEVLREYLMERSL